MTPAEFKTAIARLGLSQERAGVWLGYKPRQGRRYATGETNIPGAVAKLLRYMVKRRLQPADIDRLAADPIENAP